VVGGVVVGGVVVGTVVVGTTVGDVEGRDDGAGPTDPGDEP
jgi:hypothetical protein